MQKLTQYIVSVYFIIDRNESQLYTASFESNEVDALLKPI